MTIDCVQYLVIIGYLAYGGIVGSYSNRAFN